ncbi:MAG: beta-carotene 15,15'-dioxygenase, Brp/Blh family [Polaromonas sp.]|nr:beta-carotene 15,15'-dioxygenase, Brp/Blh family [Polaromonas sp.]
MNAVRLQGIVFCAVAVITVGFSVLLAPMNPRHELVLVALLVVLLGVPHGALDPIFAQSLQRIQGRARWIGFVVLYLLLAALAVALWWLMPTLFLIGFLLLSVLHFSGDPAPGAGFAARLLYGIAVIALPAALHATELFRLFSMLVGSPAALHVTAGLQLIAWPSVLALALLVLRDARRDRLAALEMAAVGLLALMATPLLGFAVFFCGMHSARHILRTQKYASVTPQRLFLVAVTPMLAVLAMAGAGWALLPDSPPDERLLQFVFVALAALTVPHMLLVERVRFTGWKHSV